ncbi:uncharacterized protein [Diadema antillarum]|uniref:uncharacterized protein n=1 Tax=Diadema antillarum TaxID=105358 RepID=UPI003A83CC2C
MSTEDKEIPFDPPESPPPAAAGPIRDEAEERDNVADSNGQDATGPDSLKVELPSVTTADDGARVGSSNRVGEKDKLVLPSVEGVRIASATESKKDAVGSNGYVESFILEGDGDELAEEFSLPRIEVRAASHVAPKLTLHVPDHDKHPIAMQSKNSRAAIIADNAHPKCFLTVGAAGLSRAFTSGNFCPELSSRSMTVKSSVKLSPESTSALRASQTSLNARAPQMERSKTIADLPRMRTHSLQASGIMTTSKVSLFSRGGEKAKNMVFVPASRKHREDRSKSELDTKIKEEPERPESESDELTPSESGIMGTKIHQWFTMGMKQDPKHKAGQRRPKRKRHSRNLWDPGMQNRIHRGLASSMLKPNACIGNYLNDVTASRFPQVETRQIVFTR